MPKSLALLLRDAHRTVDTEVLAAAAKAGFEIQPGHAIVLRHLGEDGARPSEMAAKAQVTRQAITKALDDLERLGLVHRQPDPNDGRGVTVRYTTRGLAALHIARTRMQELEREFASQVGAKQWATFRSVLETLFDTAGRPTAQARASRRKQQRP
ncbi:MAG: MarR family transcriptional regulator [Solirubrobacterales bacterium]|nr:MarR family transcriptional regulator [Solirubrobacterales bacterium]